MLSTSVASRVGTSSIPCGFFLLIMVFCMVTGVSKAAQLEQVHMVNEDSHPHEVQPGATSRFFIPVVTEPRRLDVKCSLSGPAGPVQLVFGGVEPRGWSTSHADFSIGRRELNIDIEGIVLPNGTEAPFFDLVNRDSTRLLWHQCYNN